MEEHIWLLVEFFISGNATGEQAGELACLLGTHPDLLAAVKEFLDEYQDTDPQVSTAQKRALLARAESIREEFAL